MEEVDASGYLSMIRFQRELRADEYERLADRTLLALPALACRWF